MNNMFRKSISLFLVFVMCFSLVPASAFAEEEPAPEEAEIIEEILPEESVSSEESGCAHEYVETDRVEPSCTAEGCVEYVCVLCGDMKTESVPVLGHSYEAVVTEPTETEPGYTTYTCPLCGDSYVADYTETLNTAIEDEAVFGLSLFSTEEPGTVIDDFGKCGDNVTWTLYDDGLLLIEGIGEMESFDSSDNIPWWPYSIKKVIIDSGVTSIGNYAFCGCRNITTVTIPESVKSIGDHAFESVFELSSITIPIGVTNIGKRAFAGCLALNNVTIPSSVTSVGDEAFHYCENLTSVSILEGVKSIGKAAFATCINLENITIPTSIISIGDDAFANCDSITDISIPMGVKNISYEMFFGCDNLTNITIPSSITSIGERAFAVCPKLESITIPSGVSSIAHGAFTSCENLKRITLPLSITYIGEAAFNECDNLSYVYYYGSEEDRERIIIEEAWNGWIEDAKWIYYEHSRFNRELDGLPFRNPMENIADFPFSMYSEVFGSIAPFRMLIAKGSTGLGLCFGMSLYASRVFMGTDRIPSKYHTEFACGIYDGINSNDGHPYIDLEYSGEVFNKIGKYQLVLVNNLIEFNLERIDSGKESKIKAKLSEINSSKIPYIIDIYGDVRHALVYDASRDIEYMPDGNAKVYVYDSEKPMFEGTTCEGYNLDNSYLIFDFNRGKVLYPYLFGGYAECKSVAFIPVPKIIGYDYYPNINISFSTDNSNDQRTISVDLLSSSPFSCSNEYGSITKTADGEIVIEGEAKYGEAAGMDNYYQVSIPGTKCSISSPGEVSFLAFSGGKAISGLNLAGGSTEVDFEQGSIKPGDTVADGSSIVLGNYSDEKNEYNKVVVSGDVGGEDAVLSIDGNMLSLTGIEDESELTVSYQSDATADAEGMETITAGELNGTDIRERGYLVTVGADIKADIRGNGTVEGEGQYPLGETVTLRAVPDEGYLFLGWYDENDGLLTHDDTLEFVSEESRTLKAKFADTVVLKLSSDYLLLNIDESKDITVSAEDSDWTGYYAWATADENGKLAGGDVISIDENGKVTALKEGTAYAVASVTVDGETYSARCRIDVVADDEPVEEPPEEHHPVAAAVTGASLPVNKAAVELYSTGYTQFDVLLEMERLTNAGIQSFSTLRPETELPVPEKNGASIELARFTDTAASERFDLVPVDDRTLAIVPKYETLEQAQTNAKSVLSSYKSGIVVTVDGTEFEVKDAAGNPAVMTVAVKKSLPKVKVGALKFNSVVKNNTQPMVFTGGTVTDVEAVSKPGWLNVNGVESASLADSVPAKASGKMNLLLTVDGWAMKQAVTVNCSAAPTYPKVSLFPSSATLKPGTCDCASMTAKVTPAVFENRGPEILRITEGTNIYTFGSDPSINDILDIGYENGTVTVKPVLDDGLAHSYKVYYRLEGVEKEYSFAVKTLPEKTAVTLSVKQSGGIDTAVKDSPITLTITPKNFHSGSGEIYEVRVDKYRSATKETVDATGLFKITTSGNVLTLTEIPQNILEPGCIYYAYTKAYLGNGMETAEVKTKLNVKWSVPEKVPAGVTLKANGSIDVIRPETEITITPTYKNCFIYSPEASDLVFFKTENKVKTKLVEAPFNVEVRDGKFIIRANGEPINHKTQKYSVMLEDELFTSKEINLSVKQGSVKVTQDVKEVVLLARDRYSSGEVSLNVADKTLSSIKPVTLDAASGAYFTIMELGGNRYSIGFKENRIPEGFKPGTTKTVKLNVFFEGNETGTANKVLSVKVSVK